MYCLNRDLYKAVRKDLNFNPRWAYLALYTLEDVVLWCGFFFLLQQSLAVSFLASVPFALLMFRNQVFMHEAVHGIAAPNNKLNYVLGLISGAVCFLPFSLWKAIHMEHHYWTGNFDKDPALEVVKRYPKSSPFMKGVFTVMWRTRFPVMAFFQYIVFWGHSVAKLIKNRRDIHLWLSLVCPLVLWGSMIVFATLPQIAVVAAGIFLYSLLFDFINLPHHVGVYSYDPDQRNHIWEQHSVSRSCRYPKFLEHLVLNFNFHAEHHMMPDLPWHELPQAHEKIKGAAQPSDTFYFIRAGWLARQRAKSFAEFLRPDLYTQSEDKKDQQGKPAA